MTEEELTKFLDGEIGKAIDAEDELELELGLAKKEFPYLSTELEIQSLEYQLKHWREKIEFIKKIKTIRGDK